MEMGRRVNEGGEEGGRPRLAHQEGTHPSPPLTHEIHAVTFS